MPIPSPKGEQDKDSFISRCMGNQTMVDEFPDQKQRAAVCYSKYKQSKKNSKGSEVQWDDDEVDNFSYIIY